VINKETRQLAKWLWSVFIGLFVLLCVMQSLVLLSDYQQQQEASQKQAEQQLDFLTKFISEKFSGDYVATANLLELWAQAHPEIISVNAVTSEGVSLLHYEREKTGVSTHFTVTKKHPYGLEKNLEIRIVKDFYALKKSNKTLIGKLILLLLLFVSLLGFLLWNSVQRLALKPLFIANSEVHRLEGCLRDQSSMVHPVYHQNSDEQEFIDKNQDLVKENHRLLKKSQLLEDNNQALGEFAYIASHDLKEPLRGIYHYVHVLLDSHLDSLNDDGRRKLETLGALSVKMDNMLNALLEYSRIGRLQLNIELTDTEVVINKVAHFLSMQLQEQNIGFRIVGTFPEVACDPVRLEEVFRHLIGNAMKYHDKADRWIEVGYLDQYTDSLKYSRGVFYIKDNGIGIPEKHQKMVFQIFKKLYPGETHGKGEGVGLTLAKMLVERHNGEIWVSSEERKNFTVYFTLDAA
jgi:signal transduction histidine kinase